MAVHAYGVASLLDGKQTLEAVEQVVGQYEPGLLLEKNIITDEFRDKMLPGIVGLKVELSHIEGKLKLGQLRKKEDQVGVYNALTQSSNLEDQALAHYMKKINPGTGAT